MSVPLLVAVGVCGSGKTYALQTIIADEIRRKSDWRILVLDTNGEWPGPPAIGLPKGTYAGVVTPQGAKRALDAGARAVLVRPASLVGDEEKARELADALAFVATSHLQPVMLVLPEVHRYAREGKPLPQYLGVIVHQWRHTRTGLLCDTQHFQDVKKEILRECGTFLLFAQRHHTSLDQIEALAGATVRAQVEEASRRKDGGDPGWCVRWPPNEITRLEKFAAAAKPEESKPQEGSP